MQLAAGELCSRAWTHKRLLLSCLNFLVRLWLPERCLLAKSPNKGRRNHLPEQAAASFLLSSPAFTSFLQLILGFVCRLPSCASSQVQLEPVTVTFAASLEAPRVKDHI